ncbi:hypothetical protein LINPERHAP1_LOCUS22099 [Linum perenne]
MKHSSARNFIARAFGLLKMRWAILRGTTWLSLDIVARMVHACCLIHIFIKKQVGDDGLERVYMRTSSTDSTIPAEQMEEVISSMHLTPEWTNFRSNKAQEMWDNRSRCL